MNVWIKGGEYNYWQGKQKPFSSPGSGGGVTGSSKAENFGNKIGESEVRCGFDVAFEQLKHTRKENVDCIDLPADGEVESSSMKDTQGSRKRQNPFEGLSLHLNLFGANGFYDSVSFDVLLVLMFESVHIYCSFVLLFN